MRDDHATPALAEQFRRFATGMERDGAPLYARISAGVATDDDLLDLVAMAPVDQRRPNILLAAVHFLLLSGVEDPLADHYPTVAAWRGERTGDARPRRDTFAAFRRFCLAHREDLARLIATRSTQTNEVGRCAALLPGLVTVSERAGRPLSVVDLGSAAGLNLRFDRYHYEYRSPEGETLHAGAPAADAGVPGAAPGVQDPGPVVLRCELRAGALPTLRMPAVAARLGVDRRPVDAHDDEAVRWLLACEWPDHLERFRTVHQALQLARAEEQPPIMEADMVADLLRVTAALPDDSHLCVIHSWAAAYLDPGRQRALAGAVAEIARRRPVSWLFAEAPYEVPGLPVPAPAGEAMKEATALVLVEHTAACDAPLVRRLADMHPHGRWLRWYGG